MSDINVPDSIPRPFVAAPDANRYFPSAVAEEARQRLSRSIVRGEGPALLIGSAGTGKTLLLDVLAKQFAEQMKIIPLLGGQICTRRALLQSILFELEIPYEGLDEGEMRLTLLSYLQPSEGKVRKLLLLVDESDALPSRLLSELRMLTNTSHQGELLISLVMAGGSGLEETFAEPSLAGFSQRLSSRCYLSAMGREETFQYVRAQSAAVGLQPETLFTKDGLEAIFAATDGLPRLINQLGDQIVWTAQSNDDMPICREKVQQGWSDLQQLPAPWHEPKAESHCFEGAVEFGELDSPSSHEDETKPEADEVPASIPMNRDAVAEFDFAEGYEVVEGIYESGVNAVELTVSSAETEEPFNTKGRPTEVAHDPFAEQFGQEEVVADRYVEFESALLASAPQVINRLDTAFAGELKDIASSYLAEAETGQSRVETTFSSESIHSDSIQFDEFDTELDPEEDLQEQVDQAVLPTTPGDLLIVEDERPSRAELVEGTNFRQLFSSLEARQEPARSVS